MQELETNLGARIAGLTSDLGSRTEERDLAQNELSSARASVESLERTQASQADRIARLEAQLAVAEDRWKRANAKIDADAELLVRVRKALGIGIGLLDQQQANLLEEN